MMLRYKVNCKPIFPKPEDLGKRTWGKEQLLALIPKKISLKKLIIKKGQRVDFSFIEKKMSVE